MMNNTATIRVPNDPRAPERGRREHHRGGDQRETGQQRPEMAAGVGADQGSGDQIRQHGAHHGVADQDSGPPRRRRRTPRRLKDQHRGEIAADQQRQQQKPGHRPDPVARRQRLGRLHRHRPVQLVGGVKECGLQLEPGEKTLAGTTISVSLALPVT